MALIPRYRAGAPATPGSPPMEDQRRAQVDPGDALRGLARTADAISRFGSEAPAPALDAGQEVFRGMQGLGQGIKDLGQARMEIAEKVAEIRNRTELHEAQLAMEKEAMDFAKWRESPEARDPSTWEEAWTQRMQKLEGSWGQGRKLAPVVEDAVKKTFQTFSQRQAGQIGLDVVKAEVRRGSEAMKAQIMRATDAGDFETAKAAAWEGYQLGLWGEDDATRMELQAKGEVETKHLSETLDLSDAFLMRGETEKSRALLTSLRGQIPEGEYQKRLADFETRKVIVVEDENIRTRLAMGEEPRALIAELEGRQDIAPAAKMKLLAPIYKAENEEFSALVKSADEAIATGVIVEADQLIEHFEGRDIDPGLFRILTAKMKGEAIKTEEAIISLQAEAARYSPETDINGATGTALEQKIALILEEDPRQEFVFETLEKRRRGEPLTLGEEIYAAKEKETLALRDAAAEYSIPASRLKMEERDGKPVFVDYEGEAPEEGDPDYFTKETGSLWWKGTKAGRVVHVSQEDRERLLEVNAISGALKKGNLYVTDLKRKGAADVESAQVLSEMKRRANLGDVTPDNWQEEYRKAATPMMEKAAAKTVDKLLAPEGELGIAPAGGTPSGALFPDPERDLQWLESLNVEASATF